ncbi:hypothetical protein V6Z12_D10G236100 [Gossypium hirsutum]
MISLDFIYSTCLYYYNHFFKIDLKQRARCGHLN